MEDLDNVPYYGDEPEDAEKDGGPLVGIVSDQTC